MKYFSKTDLISINKHVIQRDSHKNAVHAILDGHGLDVIVQQPQQFLFGRELYPTIWLKASFIFQKIIKKHIFADGNKRTAIYALLYFLHLNNTDVNLSSDELLKLTLKVVKASDSQDVMLYIVDFLANHKR